MKSKFLLSGLSVFILFLAITSCKKDTETEKNEKTKTELLTQNIWKFDNVKVDGADVSGIVEACYKDNNLSFSSDGNGILDEGTTKCDDEDAQTILFTWTFDANETIIDANTTLFPGGNGTFTIVSLTANQLVVSQNIEFMSVMQNAVITFKK